jgi:hypothetical protein
MWVAQLNLYQEELRAIKAGDMLTDAHMSAINTLAKTVFPRPGSWQPTTLSHTAAGFRYCREESVQIHNNHAIHWLVSTSLGNEVSVFDSLYNSPNAHMCKQLRHLYAYPDAWLCVCWQPMQKQSGGVACGLFAIAVCCEFLLGVSPAEVAQLKFSQYRMRSHLTNLLEETKISKFPKQSDPVPRIQGSATWFAIGPDQSLHGPYPSKAAAQEESKRSIAREGVEGAFAVSAKGRISKPSAKKISNISLD